MLALPSDYLVGSNSFMYKHKSTAQINRLIMTSEFPMEKIKNSIYYGEWRRLKSIYSVTMNNVPLLRSGVF